MTAPRCVPDSHLRSFSAAFLGTADYDVGEIVMFMMEDVRDTATAMAQVLADSVARTVDDFLSNSYGDL